MELVKDILELCKLLIKCSYNNRSYVQCKKGHEKGYYEIYIFNFSEKFY